MKLSELKTALIEQFFSEQVGVTVNQLDPIVEALGLKLNESLSDLGEGSQTQEPSKALSKFIAGKRTLLTIREDDNILFAAARCGKRIAYVNLTEAGAPQIDGNMASVKQALKQAKALNDDVFFHISAA